MMSRMTDVCMSRGGHVVVFVDSRPEVAANGRRWVMKPNQTTRRIMDE